MRGSPWCWLYMLAAATIVTVAAAVGGACTARGAARIDDIVSSFCSNITHNALLHYDTGKNNTLTIEGEKYDIVFSWSSEAERAASALLALAWRCAGYRDVALAPCPAHSLAERYSPDRVSVSLSARYPLGELKPPSLEAAGPGVAPATPRLHVRLAPPAWDDAVCVLAFHLPSFYRDQDKLRHCLFLSRFEKPIIFIPEEWIILSNGNSTLYKEFPTILDFLNKHDILPVYNMSRVELEKLVRQQTNQSFLFVDAELWREENNVAVFTGITPPPFGNDTFVRLVDANLRRYAPSLSEATRLFSVNVGDIREVLALETPDPLQAASTWVLQRPANTDRFLKWIDVSTKPTVHYMDVVLCEDMNNPDYHDLLLYISDKMNKITIRLNYIGIEVIEHFINCSSSNSWNEYIINSKKQNKYSRSIGTVMSGEGVYKVSEDVESLKYILSAYSMSDSRHVFPLGGTPVEFVRQFQQLLHNCSVRRVGVISETSDVAKDVSAALHRLHETGALKSSDKQLSNLNEDTITDTLKSLVDEHARIFLVNGGVSFVKNIIRVANTKMQLTPDRGYLWIVREWASPGDETMKPVEMTFAYRGGDHLASMDITDLEQQMNERWRNGTWPQHAAPLASAMLTLAIAFTQLTISQQDAINDVHAPDTYKHLIENSRRFPSMVGDIYIEKQVVKNPRVFVYEWTGDYPTSPTGHVGCLMADVPRDGSITCYTSDGAAFPPKCNDVSWLFIAIASIMFALILITTAIACHRAFRARDKRLIEEAEKMGRARLDAFTSSLAPYFVERKALKLRYQIGAGRFGLVWFGMLHEPTGGIRPVAAKALREGAVAEEQSEFFREARNLAVLQHDHVVRFVGVCVADGPPLLLMEYAFFGDLLQYLCNRRHLVESTESDSTEAQYVSAEALSRHARDAASALAFIVRRGFVHRDVRAANCLIDERRMLKLADFGMAREMSGAGNEHDGEYWCRRRSLFPVLWMAPESLSRGVFSTASDIWSLGVLVLELITLGARPYGGRSPLSVVELVAAGGRPPLPQDIDADARELLLRCWRRLPAERPTAAAIASWLEENPLAIRPALATDTSSSIEFTIEEEVDSGIGEPPGPFLPVSVRSLSFEDNAAICRG